MNEWMNGTDEDISNSNFMFFVFFLFEPSTKTWHPRCQCYDTYELLIGDFIFLFFKKKKERKKRNSMVFLNSRVLLSFRRYFLFCVCVILQYPSAKINKIKLFIWKSHRKFVGTRGDFHLLYICVYVYIHKPQDI